MAKRNSSFDNTKYEIAKELNIDLKHGYNGDLRSADAGRIGGQIVKKVFDEYAKRG
jgi:hypothetical protein